MKEYYVTADLRVGPAVASKMKAIVIAATPEEALSRGAEIIRTCAPKGSTPEAFAAVEFAALPSMSSADREALESISTVTALKAQRIKAGLSQAKLADAAGCIRQHVSRWEIGIYSISAVNLKSLAHALHCRVDDII